MQNKGSKHDPSTANGASKHLESSSLKIWAGKVFVSGDIDQLSSIHPISHRACHQHPCSQQMCSGTQLLQEG